MTSHILTVVIIIHRYFICRNCYDVIARAYWGHTLMELYDVIYCYVVVTSCLWDHDVIYFILCNINNNVNRLKNLNTHFKLRLQNAVLLGDFDLEYLMLSREVSLQSLVPRGHMVWKPMQNRLTDKYCILYFIYRFLHIVSALQERSGIPVMSHILTNSKLLDQLKHLYTALSVQTL